METDAKKTTFKTQYYHESLVFSQLHPFRIYIYFNSLRPSDAYMPCQTKPSLAQIMACRLVGTKSLSTNAGIVLIGTSETNFSDILIETHTFSIQENACHNAIWNMAAILSRPQCVNIPHNKYMFQCFCHGNRYHKNAAIFNNLHHWDSFSFNINFFNLIKFQQVIQHSQDSMCVQ